MGKDCVLALLGWWATRLLTVFHTFFHVKYGDDFGLSPYSALSLVRQWIHAVRQYTRLSGFIFLRMGDDFTMFPYTAQFLVLNGTCFASVFGFGFQVFLRG